MTTMNPYALPNIIAFVLLLVLSFSVIFREPREKRNQLLFTLCLFIALSVGAASLLHLSTSESEANFWNKWPYIFGIPSYIFTVEYSLQISDRIQRLKETLIGVPIAVHRWIIYLFQLFWWLILIFTDLLISPVKFYVPTGWEHQYGTLFKPWIVFGLYLFLCHFFILYRGIKSALNAIEKKQES